MPNNDRSVISRENTEFYDRTLLERVIPKFNYQRFAQVRDIPANSGTNTIKFRRYASLTAATTPLTEGITPTGSQLSQSTITAEVAQYGDYMIVTDVVSYESKDPILTEMAEILGDQAGDTLDQLTRDVLLAGTSVYYGGVATSRVTVAAGELITATLIKKSVRLLKNNKAMKISEMVNASVNVGTTPLQSCFIGFVHPNTVYTLKGLTGWKSVETYSQNKVVMEDEVGALDEVRFIESTNAKVFTGAGAAGIDVYGTLIVAAHAYGVTRVTGQAMKNIVKPLGSGGSVDPLDQRQTSGWKATFVAKILNNDFMVRLEHAVEA